MSVAKIIIISGPPCAGKTTLASLISKKYHLPIVEMWHFRKLLSDIYGWDDLNLHKKNRKASHEMMHWIIEFLADCKQPFIVDAAFWWDEDCLKLCALQNKYKFKVLQISLFADGKTLWERYQKRVLSGGRHPGYIKNISMSEMRRRILKGVSAPPKLQGKVYKINTTDFNKVDYKKIFKKVEIFCAKNLWQKLLKNIWAG